MKSTITSFLLLMMVGLPTAAQNLIPNPGFEDINRCITYEALCSPEGWRNEYGGKANVIDTNYLSPPYEGNKFSYIAIFNEHRDEGDREFLQVPLICPLREGAEYTISIYVKPVYLAVTQLGIYFAENSRCDIVDSFNPGHDSRYVIPFNPQVVFADSTGLYDKTNISLTSEMKWRHLTATYKARGNEQFLFFGSFQRNKEMDFFKMPDTLSRNRSIYLVDAFSIEPVNPVVLERCCYNANRQTIYANDIRHFCPGEEMDYHNCDTIQSGKIIAGVPFTMENLNFEVDEAQILPEAYPELDSLAHYLKRHPEYHLKIHGHTDSQGGKSYNQILSQARADRVRTYLIDKGIAPDRITAKGHGYMQPVASNETANGRSKNRRVEFYIE